jgi:hypothetical protein
MKLFLLGILLFICTPAFAQISSYTAETLPLAQNTPIGRIISVTDAFNSASCSVGFGVTVILCRNNGKNWIPIGTGFQAGSPGPIGNISASTGAFTTLTAASIPSAGPIGTGTPSTGAFTSLTATSIPVPGPIGGTTPSTGRFTSLNATSIPIAGPIGGTTPNTGNFTSLNATSIPIAGPIGGGTPNTGAFTSLTATSITSAGPIGGGTPSTGAFTSLSTGGGATLQNTSGLTTKDDGLTTAGLGHPIVLAVLDQTGVSTANSGTPQNILASTPAAGHYTGHLYVTQSAGCATLGLGAFTATIGWSDATHARTSSTQTLTIATIATGTGDFIDFPFGFWASASSAITVTANYTACTVGTWTYDLHSWVGETE